MHDLLSPYHHSDSLVHRIPAGLKLLAAVSFVVCVVLLPREPGSLHGAAALLLAAALVASRVPVSRFARRLAWAEPFALGVALLALFQPGGFAVFVSILVRATLCLAAMVLLSATTRFTDIVRVLWRLRVPGLLVTTLALMHRYLFLLVEESERMGRARRSRTFGDGKAAAWRSSASVAGALFVRSTERAERIWSAMVARGWKA